MKSHNLTVRKIESFKKHLVEEEKSEATIEKYIRDVNAFFAFSGSKICKDTVIAYKQKIIEEYAVRSVNSMIASINALFTFLGWTDLKVKSLKVQQEVFWYEC